MISLKKYFEAVLSGANYAHGNDFKYVKLLLQNIIDDKPILLGANGKGGSIPIRSDIDKTEIERFATRFPGYDRNGNYIMYEPARVPSLKDFEDFMHDHVVDLDKFVWPRGNLWNKIFKGTFSGYVDGLKSKNKGNLFEDVFKNNWETYINKFRDYGLEEDVNYELRADGEKNNKREIKITKNGVSSIHGLDIGKVISDITVQEVHRDPLDSEIIKESKDILYLSLKCGKKTSFISMGITGLFDKKALQGEEKDLSDEAKTLMEIFGLEFEKIKTTFLGYEEKSTMGIGKVKNMPVSSNIESAVNITRNLQKNKSFKELLSCYIGYGYLLVHADSPYDSNFDIIDLRTEDNMNDLIGKVERAAIYYGGLSHTGKRIDILISLKLENGQYLNLDLNIRTKASGGVYPTFLCGDYKFSTKSHDFKDLDKDDDSKSKPNIIELV